MKSRTVRDETREEKRAGKDVGRRGTRVEEANRRNPTLHNNALLAPLVYSRQERCAGCILEDLTHTLTRLGTAFEIMTGTNLLHDGHALRCTKGVRSEGGPGKASLTHFLGSHGPLLGLSQFLNCLGVTSEILLTPNKDDGEASAEMHDFRDPL
jgi:hypothetical protein